jgi:hypothetical protein
MVEWWNGVELWVTGLAFPLQFALVMVVLGPLFLVLAWAIDRVVDHASAWFGPAPGDEAPLGGEPVDDSADDSAGDGADSSAEGRAGDRVDGADENTDEHSEDLVDSASR